MIGRKRMLVVVGFVLSCSLPPTPSRALTPTPTAPPTAGTPTSTSAATPTLGPCYGDCNLDGRVAVDEILTMVDAALGIGSASACPAGDINHDGKDTIDEILAAVRAALDGCVPLATPTAEVPTATSTPTPTETIVPTYGPLGVRHFMINPDKSKSPFQAALGPGLTITLAGFQGQSNSGAVEPAFLDLEAGQPDPVTGVATINVVAASDFIFADGRAFAAIVICLKPLVPVMSAGVVACNGGYDLSFLTSVDHNIGEIGVNGFTAADCQAMHGHVEGPNQICAAGNIGVQCRTNADCDTTTGAGDGLCGLDPTTCRMGKVGTACRSDGDCDTTSDAQDGVCGGTDAHPGVCNGALTASLLPGETNTGSGAVVIAPYDAPNDQQLHLVGLPVRLSVQTAPPCTDPGPDADITFALTSGTSRSTILDFSNMPGKMFTFDVKGQNFSCADWTDTKGPGRLALSAAALDQNPGGGDVITGFTFDGSPPKSTATPTVNLTPTVNPTATINPTPVTN